MNCPSGAFSGKFQHQQHGEALKRESKVSGLKKSFMKTSSHHRQHDECPEGTGPSKLENKGEFYLYRFLGVMRGSFIPHASQGRKRQIYANLEFKVLWGMRREGHLWVTGSYKGGRLQGRSRKRVALISRRWICSLTLSTEIGHGFAIHNKAGSSDLVFRVIQHTHWLILREDQPSPYLQLRKLRSGVKASIQGHLTQWGAELSVESVLWPH